MMSVALDQFDTNILVHHLSVCSFLENGPEYSRLAALR